MKPLDLEDRLDLHELAARYGDNIDDRDWQALDRIFTEDAIFEVVDLVRMEGLAEIKRYMHEEGRHPLAHLITNIHVAQDADGVRLRCRGVFPISAPGGGPGHRVFHGSYYDRVVKTSAGWRIKERTFSAARLPCGSPGS
ncbi:MAG: nuclear transport factor 2 family protein [Halieaceae bacterium]|nr:nuclear transport factor 2 family protein [Halieaceae bacterium]